MSDPATVEMLPAEIAHHAPLDFFCPNCQSELTISLQDVWATESERCYFLALKTPGARQSLLERFKERNTCPACQEKFDLTLEPVISYRAHAVKVDPLEKYPPASRYWERQKRGMTDPSANLKL